jgi:hypothetical protein
MVFDDRYIGMDLKRSSRDQMEVLSLHFPGGPKENHEIF